MDGRRFYLYVLRMCDTAGHQGWSFTLSSIRHAQHAAEAEFVVLPQWSSDLHLIHTIEGEGVLQIDGRDVEADPGVVVAVPVFKQCSWRKAAGARWTMINLHVRIVDPNDCALHERQLLPERFAPTELDRIHRDLAKWHAALSGNDRWQAGLVAIEALSVVGSYLAHHGGVLPATEARLDGRLIELSAQLRDTAHLPFDIDALARHAGLGRSQCDRLFRATFGVSPKAYWTRHRLGMAQALLIETAMQIGDIADRLGFSDIYYFSRWFRHHSKVTASSFRQHGREL